MQLSIKFQGFYQLALFIIHGTIIAIIYYPLFTRVDKWATKLGDKYMKIGKKVAGKEIGSIVAFVAGLFALFYFYGKEWFNTNVFSSFIKAVGKWFS